VRLTILEIIGLAAVILGPILAFVIPTDFRLQFSSADVSLKDLVLLGLVLLLGLGILLLRGFRKVLDWTSIRPFYSRVEFQYFYSTDATVVTRNRFDLVNGWTPTEELPEENLIWHREIVDSDLVYRLYERGRYRDRTMGSHDPKIEFVLPTPVQEKPSEFRYVWTPTIQPKLTRKEPVSYMVEIVAAGTETAAFEPGGTKLGFGLNLPCNLAEITAYAPFGYEFELVEPKFTIRDTEDLSEVPIRTQIEPLISPDGTILSLTIKRPRAGLRYWAHYRFKKTGG